jgi:hypothetical protein
MPGRPIASQIAAALRLAGRPAAQDKLGGVGLLPLDEGLHVNRRDQHDPMPHRLELARPVVRGTARLHADRAGRQRGEIIEQLAAADRALVDLAALGIDRVHLEHMLGQIEADARDRRMVG